MMSIQTTDLISEIERWAPLACAEAWDNSGWQVDLRRPEVGRVLVALDLTKAVAEEASEKGADFLLAHHPLFFDPVKRLLDGVDNDGTAIALIRAGISLYSAHTSFDAAPDGMNEVLAEMIGLSGIRLFPGNAEQAIARQGDFAPLRTFGEVCQRAEAALGMQGRLRVTGPADAMLKTGAVCGGAGGGFVPDVVQAGLDFYLTGDIKHDDALYAGAHGLCLIDGGHWGTERHFIPVMAERLRTAFGGAVEVLESGTNKSPWA
ncbi:MAG: Nif3-like dinuclear metal center hexameric protein [Clostridiales Family XIII bacterium]|jgi:dinuclear metal center YbgI/SA1388 family protein|nr:Nif3-like dinuclear metal center hexameric protein [Clostridiales Family XIII bacterium]